jgi:hypothetical protein
MAHERNPASPAKTLRAEVGLSFRAASCV